MKKLMSDELEILTRGCAILGSGGGGDPRYDILMAKHVMGKTAVTLCEVADLREDDLVVPLAFMGAPLVSLERIPSGREFISILSVIEKTVGKKPTVLMPAEIGGANAFTPLIVAAQTGLPVLNADTIGRAFPELQMSTCNLKGIKPAPAFIADSFGRVKVLNPIDCMELESQARTLTKQMGSSSAIGVYLMHGNEVSGNVVEGSYTRAMEVGIGSEKGKVIARGKIMDIDQCISDGFLKGTVTLDTGVTVYYQNEYLVAKCEEELLAASPDILMFLEEESGIPISSESLQYGLRVELITLPSPDIWKSPEALKLIGGLTCV